MWSRLIGCLIVSWLEEGEEVEEVAGDPGHLNVTLGKYIVISV